MSKGQAELKVVDQSAVKYGRGSKKWEELTDSVSYYIAKDTMPIYAVEKTGFKTLLKSLIQNMRYLAKNISPKLHYQCCMRRLGKQLATS